MIEICKNELITFNWDHLDSTKGRLGIVSKNLNHPMFNQLKEVFTKQKGIVIQLTTENRNLVTEDYLSIMDFEGIPSEDPDSYFAATRMNWVQEYLKLISYINKKDRNSFIPKTSFRSHVEGPMMGYVRASKELADTTEKEILLNHFSKLEKVKWFRSEEEGFVYEITGDTEEELLESLFIGAWSLWTFVHTVKEENPLNVMIELTGSLVKYPVLEEKREFITYAISTISKLSFNYVLSCVIKSSNLFPCPESAIVDYIIDTNPEDFDISGSVSNISSLKKDVVIWKHESNYQEMELVLAKDNLI